MVVPLARATAASSSARSTTADPNGFAYQGVSEYFTTDVRVRYQIWQAVERRRGHRQPQQLPVLEFPPLPAAQLHGGNQI
jgi:hypothetical protein